MSNNSFAPGDYFESEKNTSIGIVLNNGLQYSIIDHVDKSRRGELFQTIPEDAEPVTDIYSHDLILRFALMHIKKSHGL